MPRSKSTKSSKEKKDETKSKSEQAKDEPEETKEENEKKEEETVSEPEGAIEEEKPETKSETSSEEEKEKEKEEKEEKKPKELTEEDIIKIIKSFSGIGQVIAERIYKAGFDSREELQSITADDLMKIRGIGRTMAENIANGMEKAISDFDSPPKKEEKKMDKGITDKAVGFIKGTFSKITGFFKGKLPKSKPGGGDESKSKTDTKPEDKASGKEPEQKEPEKSAEDELYPEVGAPEETAEQKSKVEPVTVEASEIEPEEELPKVTDTKPEPEPEVKQELEQEPEPKSEPEPEPKPEPEPERKINVDDSSGLLIWFETTPALRSEAGKLVFKAGYNNLIELKEAVVDDLVLIKGIDQQEAETIFDELQKLD